MLDPKGEYLTSAWRDHVYPLAAKMKLPMKMPPIQPRSRLAHEAAPLPQPDLLDLQLEVGALGRQLEEVHRVGPEHRLGHPVTADRVGRDHLVGPGPPELVASHMCARSGSLW